MDLERDFDKIKTVANRVFGSNFEEDAITVEVILHGQDEEQEDLEIISRRLRAHSDEMQGRKAKISRYFPE